MLSKTFYISASSEIRDQVRELAARLPGKWFADHDWTHSFDLKAEDRPSDKFLSFMDLQCAVEAEHFIYLDSEHFSRGGMMEYGARLAVGRTIVHIGCRDKDYLFFNAEGVTHYESVEDLFDRGIVDSGAGQLVWATE